MVHLGKGRNGLNCRGMRERSKNEPSLLAGCSDAHSHTSSSKHIPASFIPLYPEGLGLLLQGPADTHLIDADLLELLLSCSQRGRGRAGGHVLLVTGQGHVLLQTEGQGQGGSIRGGYGCRAGCTPSLEAASEQPSRSQALSLPGGPTQAALSDASVQIPCSILNSAHDCLCPFRPPCSSPDTCGCGSAAPPAD